MTVGILLFGLVMGPMFEAGTTGAVADARRRAGVDGPDVWAARHRTVGVVSDVRAVHGKLPDLQLCGDLRRLTGPLHRHVARQPVRLAVRRLLPSAAASLTLIGLLATRETKDEDLMRSQAG